MDPISEAIEGLQSDLVAFREDDGARILRLISDPKDGSLISKTIRAEEWQPENRSPFLVFDTAYNNDLDAFSGMSRTVREHYALLRGGVAEEGTDLPEFGTEPGSETDPLQSMADHVRRFAVATEDALEPPVFCWLPTSLSTASAWVDSVIGLMRALWDTPVRFILLDDGEGVLHERLETVRDLERTAEFRIDEQETLSHFGQLLSAPSLGRGPGALPGAAAPDVVPPPRPGPAAPSDAQIQDALKKAGLPPILSIEDGERLRRLVLEAAEASGRGDEKGTLEKQTGACHLCREAGQPLEEVLMTMLLAGYFLQFRREREAEDTYRLAEELCGNEGFYPQLSQTRIALGYLFLKNKRLGEAAAIYEQAAAAAVIGEVNLLFIEALRLAGTCHLRLGQEEDALYCWRGAVDRARSASPDEVRNTKFTDVAASLLDLLRRHGLHQQASSVEALVKEVGAAAGA